jgi:hypothetical protein
VATPYLNPRKLFVESAAFGLGYTAVLIWIGSALVGSFGYESDADPYWPDVPHLRTDTTGFIAFFIAIVTLILSRYLELRRRNDAPATQVPVHRRAGVLFAQSLADTGMFLATALVIYLSCNAFEHPVTLTMQLTHLFPSGPSEGTVRVIALGICLVSVAARRYLRVTATRPAQPAPTPENTVAQQTVSETADLTA